MLGRSRLPLSWQVTRLLSWLGFSVVFISYRNGDAAREVGPVYERLVGRFGRGRVILDAASFPFGYDYRVFIEFVVSISSVVVVIIGPEWLGNGQRDIRPLDDPEDAVRLELTWALERNRRIVPVLVGDARFPSKDELPKELQALIYRHGIRVRGGLDFQNDLKRLVAGL